MAKRIPRAGIVEAFWTGLTKPSGAALISAAVVLALLLLATALYSERLAIRAPGYLTSYPSDDHMFITSKVLHLSRSESASDGIVILGASCVRSAVREDALREHLLRHGLTDPVIVLTGAAQTVWESFAIADRIAPTLSGVYVVSVNPLRLSRGRGELLDAIENPRLGFSSAGLIGYAKGIGIDVDEPLGLYAWDNRKFLRSRLPHLAYRLFRGPVEHAHTRLANRVDEVRMQQMRTAIVKEWEAYDANIARTLHALLTLSERLRGHGAELVLLESPVNPRFVIDVEGEEFYSSHRARVRAFAEHRGLRYLTLDSASSLTDLDFADWCHIADRSAQHRISRSLADQLYALRGLRELH